VYSKLKKAPNIRIYNIYFKSMKAKNVGDLVPQATVNHSNRFRAGAEKVPPSPNKFLSSSLNFAPARLTIQQPRCRQLTRGTSRGTRMTLINGR
jgi:hypothetical protein